MDTQLESYHSSDLETEGFDLHAGKSWIYPTNYPMREYQFRITQEALYQNTLVSLPTGLGKTFIASVVMYNFYRWYPSGKVIFMAPTRPLVKQQIEACYDITAIPQNVTAELTGTKAQISREEIWRTKRVFFITPQVLQNDIDTFPDLAKQIKCLVIDEAHKARGNHAYCEVIRKLNEHSKYFRVLALSATPGNSTNDVIDMSMNLLISHLEVRTEESPDVAPYVFQRHLETVVVPLGGKLEEMRSKYLRVLERYVKVLKDHNIITGNCANLTKGKIFMTLKDFNLRAKYQRHPKHDEISRTLTICITLYHGYELLIRHGMRGFLNFFEEHSKKSLLKGNSQLFAVMDEMQKYIGPRPDISLLPDGTIPQIETNSKFGHPKFYKLRNILLEYFANDENKESKVIIFSEFKETVMEAYAMLMQHPPIIRPKYFMGQGAITQKQQITIIKSFKEGRCNVLISTCIGEEGLDIGEVDLIICFDISNKSPIRLIQRMGRTGRKKQGKVIILVTEGKEQELLREALGNKKNVTANVLRSNEIPKHLYKDNPRMIPENIFPSCNKMFISVPKVSIKSKSGNIKDMFSNLTKNETASQILKDVEIIENEEIIPSAIFLWNQSEPLSDNLELIGYNKNLDTLRVHQPIENIQHSKDTDILVSLLQFADAKRYNLPITQTSELSQNKKRKITRSESNDNFKQTDIRNLFIKPKITSVEVVNENITQEIKENVTKKKNDSLTNDLFTEITSYLNICYEEKETCYFCEKTCLCKRLTKPKPVELNPIDLTHLDISSIEALTEYDLDMFLQDLKIKATIQDLYTADFDQCFNDDVIVLDEESLRMESPKKENIFQFEPPKSIRKVINQCESSNNKEEYKKSTQLFKTDVETFQENIKSVEKIEEKSCIDDNLGLFHLENVDDLFETDTVSSVPLNSGDSFENFDKSPILFDTSIVISTRLQEKSEDERPSSPIFGTFSKKIPRKPKVNLKSKLDSASKSSFYINKRNRIETENLDIEKNEEKNYSESSRNSNHSNYSEDLFDSPINTHKISNLNVLKSPLKENKKLYSLDDSFEENHFGLSQEIQKEPINEGEFENKPLNSYGINSCMEQTTSKKRKMSQECVNLNIADLCDESFFGFTEEEPTKKKSKVNEKETEKVLISKKLCDEFFGLTQEIKQPSKKKSKNTEKALTSQDLCDELFFGLTQELNEPSKKISKVDEKVLTSQDLCDESFFGLTQELNEPSKKGSKVDEKVSTSQDLYDESFVVLTQELKKSSKKKSKVDEKHTEKLLTSEDLCDESFFGLTHERKTNQQSQLKSSKTIKEKNTGKNSLIRLNQKDDKKSQDFPLDLDLNDICDESFFGLTQELLEQTKTNSKKEIETFSVKVHNKSQNSIDLNVGNINDESYTGLTQKLNKKSTKNSGKNENLNKETSKKKFTSEKPSVSKRNKPHYDLLINDTKVQSSVSLSRSTPSRSIDSNISDICDMSFFGLTQKPQEISPKKSGIVTIEDSPIKNDSNELTYSDDSLSPIYDYTAYKTVRKSKKKSQHQRNDFMNNEGNFTKSPSKHDSENVEIKEQLSPVLTQKFKKSNLLKLKSQSSCVNDGKNDDVKRKLIFSSNLTHSTEQNTNNLTSYTVTQVIDMINQPNEPQSSNKNKKKLTALDLLDDDEAFENVSYKTPIKSKSSRKLTLKTPKSTKKIKESTSSFGSSDGEIQKTPKSTKKLEDKAIYFTSSDDDFQVPSGLCQKQLPLGLSTRRNESKSDNVTSNRNKRKKKLKNPFIDDEAEVTSEEQDSEDSESENTQDSYNTSFVTQADILNTTSLHVKYLESVKSPLQLNGRFKIPDRQINENIDVFSQKENVQDNSYLEDSFCVNISESQLPVDKELSELEIAERLLEEDKKHKKNKHKYKEKDKVVNIKKKRRIIIISDSE